MQDYFKQFFVLRSSEVYIFISDQNVNAKSNRNRNFAVFHFLRNPKGCRLDYFFYVSHTRHNVLQTDTYIDELVENFSRL